MHESAVRRISKYLASTSKYVDLQDRNRQLTKRGVFYRPDIEKNIECYVDSEFYGGWSQVDANNVKNIMSNTGYIITNAGCPVLWCSTLRTEIDLSTTEAEYIALSQAMK